MPAPILTPAAAITCPHGGKATITPGGAHVLAGGAPAAVQTDATLVAGCAFVVGVKPQPCVLVRWMAASTRVFVGGVPALTQVSTGMCFSADQIPAGPPIIASAQPRAMGT